MNALNNVAFGEYADKNTTDETAWVTVQGFMKRYNCGRSTAMRYMNEFPYTVKIAGKLQMPVEKFERYIEEEAARQRQEAPLLVPEI